jgi:hypothetical protein
MVMRNLLRRLLDGFAERVADRVMARINAAPPMIEAPSARPSRFWVGVTLYDGAEGSGARKTWERERMKGAPAVGRLEFYDGDDCRGRYPE